MTAHPLRLAVLLAVVSLAPLLLAHPATADNTPGGMRAPTLDPSALDLLPFDDLQRVAFNKKHGVLVYRTQALHRQWKKLRDRLAAHKNKKDAAALELQKEIRRVGAQAAALMARLTDEIQAFGVDGALLAYMNHAPTGAGRLQRYSHGLVLLLDDLTPAQRALFGPVVAQVDGAYHAITAQKERTLLALEQAELPRDKARGVAATFDRQLQVIDQRFWILVDYALSRDQRVAVWNQLPQRIRRKSQALEHMYALPGLTASQGTRLRALVTEIEHEASPDSATAKRVGMQLRDKSLTPADRKKLTQQRTDAYKRLGVLNAFRRAETRKILTEEQWLEFLSIPPRISTNERSGNYNRVLAGWKPSAEQTRAIQKLGQALRLERRAAQKRMAEIRRVGADYGPDSPQMMGMQMEMAGAKADGAAASRAHMGAIFTQVMRPEEVGKWVMGHWGYKR